MPRINIARLFAATLLVASFYGFTFADVNSVPVVNKSSYSFIVNEIAQPLGGMQSIVSKISYPALALQNGLEGRVAGIAYVNSDGTVSGVEVLKSVGGGCDEAFVKAIKESKFVPGSINGVSVNCRIGLYVDFKK